MAWRHLCLRFAGFLLLVRACQTLPLAFEIVPPLDYHAEHSIPAAEYQAHFDSYKDDGYILRLVTGFTDSQGSVFYNTIWHKNTAGVSWASYHGMTSEDYQANFNENAMPGCDPCYAPVFVDGFSTNGGPRFNVIYEIQNDAVHRSARHIQSPDAFQAHFDTRTESGYDLDIVATYQCAACNPQDRVASLFSKQTNDNVWTARHIMNRDQYQEEMDDLVEQDYSPKYISVGTESDMTENFAAIWEKNNGGPAWYLFQRAWTQQFCVTWRGTVSPLPSFMRSDSQR